MSSQLESDRVISNQFDEELANRLFEDEKVEKLYEEAYQELADCLIEDEKAETIYDRHFAK